MDIDDLLLSGPSEQPSRFAQGTDRFSRQWPPGRRGGPLGVGPTRQARADHDRIPPPRPDPADELLTIEQVADLIRMPVATLRYWRVLDTGPHGFIIGRRLRYWRQDVLDWLDEQRESTGRGAA